MATSTSAPINRALVRQLRGSAPLMTVIVGGIHEKVAPRKVKYPFVTYGKVSAPYDYAWGMLTIEAVFDVFAWAENPVDARNVDQLVANALNDAALSVDGQTLLLCRRVADVEGDPDIDARGRRIYQIGGTYGIQTYQPT
jgi:hypothetical protein